MENDSSRNTVIFIVSALVILVLYQVFVMDPMSKRRQAEAKVAEAAQGQARAAAPGSDAGGFVPVSVAVSGSPRVKLDSPALSGTVALRGARLDDLYLKRYHHTTDPKSAPVEMFRPQGAEHAWSAQVGWMGGDAPGLPDANTVWTAAPGAVLTPATPLLLTYNNGQGLNFARTISVDNDYLFQISDTVTNTSARPVTLASYGSVEQRGLPAEPANSGIVHEGAIGELQPDGGGAGVYNLKLKSFKDWKKDGLADQGSVGGWLGITQKYWLAAFIPDQSSALRAQFHVTPLDGVDVFQAGYIGPSQTIAPGASITRATHLFAGAKIVPLLRQYQTTLRAPQLDNAVDWGHLWFLTRPLFDLLEYFYHHIGSIGLAILVLTVVVKAVFFPLANKSYESMSKMKKVQPQIESIKSKYAKDPAKLQQETMALYQQEKINPLMGCLPMLVQIPVFYSLYKILTVTIEMRHAPFFGWIHDLSSRDPTSIWTLFGLIPWHPAAVPLIGGYLDGPLHIGLWPLIYGASMWLSQAMNPPAADPTQQKIFQLMPLIFTFTMSQFTVGLVIYWTWQNCLSVLQQYVIMRRLKVDNPIDSLLQRFSGKSRAPV